MASSIDYFSSCGYQVLVVPEAATMTVVGGGNIMVHMMSTEMAVRREVHNQTRN